MSCSREQDASLPQDISQFMNELSRLFNQELRTRHAQVVQLASKYNDVAAQVYSDTTIPELEAAEIETRECLVQLETMLADMQAILDQIPDIDTLVPLCAKTNNCKGMAEEEIRTAVSRKLAKPTRMLQKLKQACDIESRRKEINEFVNVKRQVLEMA